MKDSGMRRRRGGCKRDRGGRGLKENSIYDEECKADETTRRAEGGRQSGGRARYDLKTGEVGKGAKNTEHRLI